ncbi:MAG TPA: SDR family NAD(P)-dependent oxidoreductase [Solirubrobacteraceae bacterium]|nr:SDR family NAD(P)-dependent oxidoreductase [Solirubrobacteraceae bacterium]
MPTTLITGATRGLGRETARRLIAAGHDVLIGARDAARGEEVAEQLGAAGVVVIDVADDASVAAAAAQVERLDVLVNNAGILGDHVPLREITAEHLRPVFETNVLGVVRVTQAFLPHLERADAPVVVNVSSGMGSMTVTGDPSRVEHGIANVTYSPSKAAVNMITTQYAKAYPGIRFNAVDPGYTATDFNGHSGPQTIEEGTDQLVAMAQIGTDGPTGTFTDRHGVVGW